MTMDAKPVELQKILLIGDAVVGKTFLASVFCNRVLPHSDYLSTIGIDFMTKDVQIGDRPIKLQIWDTAGQERFRTLSKAYYRGSHGVMFVYDICNQNSFDHIQDWIRLFELNTNVAHIPKYLVGNKSDMERNRTVSREAAEEFAINNGMRFFETSAKLFWNVDEAFLSLATDIRAFKERQPMAIFSEERIKLNKSKKSKGGWSWGLCNLL